MKTRGVTQAGRPKDKKGSWGRHRQAPREMGGHPPPPTRRPWTWARTNWAAGHCPHRAQQWALGRQGPRAELCPRGPCRRCSCPQLRCSLLWRRGSKTGVVGGCGGVGRSPRFPTRLVTLTLGSEEDSIAGLVAVGLAIVLGAGGGKVGVPRRLCPHPLWWLPPHTHPGPQSSGSQVQSAGLVVGAWAAHSAIAAQPPFWPPGGSPHRQARTSQRSHVPLPSSLAPHPGPASPPRVRRGSASSRSARSAGRAGASPCPERSPSRLGRGRW